MDSNIVVSISVIGILVVLLDVLKQDIVGDPKHTFLYPFTFYFILVVIVTPFDSISVLYV